MSQIFSIEYFYISSKMMLPLIHCSATKEAEYVIAIKMDYLELQRIF